MLADNMEFVDIFEEKLAKYTGSRYAVCTDCCTNALIISLYLKYMLGEGTKSITIPSRTYMSVPMTASLHGFDVQLDQGLSWSRRYEIFDRGNGLPSGVVDAAVDFREGMMFDDKLVCLSFQQKKRLPLGRGGAVLTNNKEYYTMLKRLVYDGRNPKINDSVEVGENPCPIILGFHAYMEPEKAARGICMLNQKSTLAPYHETTSEQYPDLTKIGIWKIA